MTMKRAISLTLSMAAALLVVVGAGPAGAMMYCEYCDCNDSCGQVCWDPEFGLATCEEFICEDTPICCNTISGTANPDTLYGTSGRDCIYGWSGGDTLHGNGGDDDVYGGSGDDTLYGDAGYDYLNGNSGHDTCYTGEVLVSCND